MSRQTTDKYTKMTIDSRESTFYPDRLRVLRDWIGQAKGLMCEDELIQTLIFIYTEIIPNEKVVEAIRRIP